MARSLRRILRFRQLAEEQARLEVERASQLLRQTSIACERTLATEQQQRFVLAESWTPEREETQTAVLAAVQEDAWLMEGAVLEFFNLQRVRLEEIREQETRRIEPMIERYKEHRRELRQTEQLLMQQAAVENMERDRRAQAETDEWFLQRGIAGRRRQERLDSESAPVSVENTSAQKPKS